MNDVMILRRGGSTKLHAAIGVTYPAGATLTCTNGTKTLKASNTNGQWVFPIPKNDEWTVTATKGTNSNAKIVNITSQGQTEKILLDFNLALFDGSLASGYSLSGNYISPPIDVSGYSSLEITGVCFNGSFLVGLIANPSGVSATNPPKLYINLPTDTEKTMYIDLSDLSGEMYLCCWCGDPYFYATTLSISENKLLSTYAGISANITGIRFIADDIDTVTS